MSETVLLYHNPHCSKSRAALAWLQQQPGIAVQTVDYRANPPSEADLRKLLHQLGTDDVRRIMRTADAAYAELGLDKTGLSQGELIAALHRHPALLQRPIAVYRQRAAIGRPLENIIALFD
ncbi:arsenate reductase (glutaredoxin) [Eikenella sp. S3360]|uniref:Arsenate reductase n=1 Tax=Eikenella glucosivorans TaxID=2766967 RepID=A0ABS0NBC1_9NEIS|nr:arsenate reductase (glutaredoxin) [Eikenella glucosivorans]MBH5329596.1 arsenate reductase (glutaredoxin) [Eikenella glucosivorans]